MEQTKFTYSPLGKAFEEKIKTIEEQKKKSPSFRSFKTSVKQKNTKSINGIFPKDMRTN